MNKLMAITDEWFKPQSLKKLGLWILKDFCLNDSSPSQSWVYCYPCSDQSTQYQTFGQFGGVTFLVTLLLYLHMFQINV